MKLSDFKIELIFNTETGKWICTDIGTRTILAIKHEQYLEFGFPPNGCEEIVFDKTDLGGCWK